MKYYSYPLFKNILQNYLSNFAEFDLDELGSSTRDRLIEQENKIKYAFKLLKAFDKSFTQTGNSYRCFKMDFIKTLILHQQFESMLFANYEPLGRNVIQVEEIGASLTDVDPFSIFKKWLETEKYEFYSMLEAIQSRNRLQAVKNSLDRKLIDYYEIKGSKLKAFIHKMRYSNPDSQLYNTEESIKAAIEQLHKLENIILTRQLNYEFPKFIEEREYKLREMVSNLGSVIDMESFKLLQITKDLQSQVS